LFIDKLSAGERQRTPQDEEPAAREPARVVEDARQGKDDDDGAPIRLRVGPPGAGELPRPQVPASEQPAEEPPSQERLPDGPAAEASNRSLAERIEMLRQSDPPQEPNPSLAERIEALRQGDTPEEPEGEVAQVTDGLAGAEAGSPAVNRSEAAPGDPRPTTEGGAPVELKLSPNRPTQARAGQPIRLSVGPAGEVEIAEGPAAKGSSSSAPTGSASVGAKGASSPAASATAQPARTASGQKPIHLSLKFPAPKSPTMSKGSAVAKPRPPGAAEPAAAGVATGAGGQGKEPVIVAKLGAGAASAGKTSPAAKDAQSKTADKAAGTALKPIRLSIKGSTVTHQSVGDVSEKAGATSTEPKKDSKAGGDEPSAKEKSAAAGPSAGAARSLARAAARLKQWSVFAAKADLRAPAEIGKPRLPEAVQGSTASLR
jgi:hypothetical protein